MSEAGAPQLRPAETSTLLAEDAAVAVDVREPAEWDAGHIAGARFIPLGELHARLDELPRDRELVLVCRSGSRSGYAADALHAAGFRASNMAGGMLAWQAAGLPLEPDDGDVV